MKKYIMLLVVFVCGLQLSFSQTKAEKKAAKKEKQEQDYAAMKSFIEKKQFTFEADWAITQGGKRISLIGNPNYLDIDQSNSKAELPYFGIAQSVSYGGDGGIKFDGPYNEYDLSYNDKKRVATLKYSITNNNESFNVTFRIFSTETASLVVFSSNRNSISYDGSLKPLKVKEE